MKNVLLIISILCFTSPILANNKFWISNKIEAGYDRIYISEKVTFNSDEFTKNAVDLGLKFRLFDDIKMKTFYQMKHSLRNDWKKDDVFGMKLEIELE